MDLALGVHASYDRFLTGYLRDTGLRPSCRAGCFSCCYAWVEASLGEVRRLRAAASPGRWRRAVAEGRRRARRLVRERRDPGLPKRHFLERRVCPFLDASGRCAVYEARPLACRGVLTDLDPGYCAPGVVPALEGEALERYQKALDPARHGPEHYLRLPLEQSREAFFALLEAEVARWGFTLAGELAVLVWLYDQPRFRRALKKGRGATLRWLKATGLYGGTYGVYLID